MVLPPVNDALLAQLKDFGFKEVVARRCLLKNPDKSVEELTEWLFTHGEDAGMDAPIPLVSPTSLLAPKFKLRPSESQHEFTVVGYAPSLVA